jgi:hypothetical protein
MKLLIVQFFFELRINSSHLGLDILRNTLFSNSLSMCFAALQNCRKMIVLCILILILGADQETKGSGLDSNKH